MRANLTPQEKQSMLDMLRIATDEMLSVLWKTITSNSSGISGMDPDLLRAFYDEFERRPGLLESMTNESKRRNEMRLTESQLRKTIRQAIIEAKNDRHDYVSSSGIRIGHGDIGGANSDFKKYGAGHRMISQGVWPKMSRHLQNAGDWQFYECSDGYRYIHDCLACKDNEGRIMMAVFVRDRNNSANATETDYDIYVLDCNLIEQNVDEVDMDRPRQWWSNWAHKGEYCVNTQQIADTLEEAYDTYEARWVG